MFYDVNSQQPTPGVPFSLPSQLRRSLEDARRLLDKTDWIGATTVSQAALQEKHELERIWAAKGTSTTRISQNDIQYLERLYVFRERLGILRFLEQYPFLVPILVEAWINIRKHFTHTRLFLEVVTDPEAVDEEQLVIFITTSMQPDEASESLDRLDDDWWLDALDRTQGKLCITLEFS